MPLMLGQQTQEIKHQHCMSVTLQVLQPLCDVGDDTPRRFYSYDMDLLRKWIFGFGNKSIWAYHILADVLSVYLDWRFIVPKTAKSHVDWRLKTSRCRPSSPVGYKVRWEHCFRCFLPIQVTSCDRDLSQGLSLDISPPPARQQGALHLGLAGGPSTPQAGVVRA